MAVTFHGEVTNLQVKAKRVKERHEDGSVWESVERVGKLTLEFDAEKVDVAALQNFIHGRYVTLDLEDTQGRLSLNGDA
jgi:hypothetical protein